MSNNPHQTPATHTVKELREFAFIMAGAFPVVFCVILPWLFSHKIPYWPLALSTVFLLQAFIYPRSLIPVQKLWMRVGAVIGWINTRIILSVLFYLLITPIGWMQRKRNKLYYKTGYQPQATSYKIPRTQRLTANDLENPF